MPPLFPLTLLLYGISGTLYFIGLLSASDRRLQIAARASLALALLAQVVDIAWLCTQGLHPVASAREAVFFAAWLMGLVYLVVSLRGRVDVLGALVVPTVLILDLAARMTPSREHHGGSALAILHITLATTGVALFAVAAAGAALYLVGERSLKKHRGSALGGRLPGLETLDRVNRICVGLGFPLFTVALVIGAVWVAERPELSWLTPQWVLATVTWGLYALLLVARRLAGWRGRRAAVLTLAGFATSLVVLAIYVFRGVSARV